MVTKALATRAKWTSMSLDWTNQQAHVTTFHPPLHVGATTLNMYVTTITIMYMALEQEPHEAQLHLYPKVP